MSEVDRQFSNVTLTGREREVLQLLTNGLTDSEIAEALTVTVGTVKWYNRQIYNKLGVRNRTEAVTQAQQRSLVKNGAQSAATTTSHNLTRQETTFIGRTTE